MQSEETKQTAEATATEQAEAPAAEQTNDNNTAAETPAVSTEDTTGTATTEAPAAETAAQDAPTNEATAAPASQETATTTDSAPEAADPAPATAEQPTVAANEQPAAQATAATVTTTAGTSAATTGGDEHSGGEMDFGAMLEQFEQEQARYREGDLVEGKVISVSDRGVVIDFGYKSEGVVKSEELTENGEVTVKRGDTLEVVIRRMDSGDGTAELSRFEAVKRRTWDDLEKAYNDGTPVKGFVTERVKGGLNVDIKGIEAFLPGSLVDSRPPRNLDVYKNQEVEARVIKFNRKRANVVLSRKALIDEVNEAQKAQTFEQLGEGYIVEGTVKSLTEYGAFVDLGGIDGLLHVTDMTWGKLDRPSDMFKPGDEVQVKVLKFDREKERVSLGLKQLQPDPWTSIEERYPINAKLRGRVSSVTDYGAFIELEPGVEGLVHVSEMSWSKRAKHPKNIVKVGDEVEVQVLRLDPKDRRVSLGMKQVMANPWETIYERFRIGQQIKGRVRNLTEFGAFVELEEGVDGLVHVTDISHKKIKHPSEALKKNQEVEAVITHIDVAGRRMSLSMKDLQPSTWDKFVSEHKPGDVVKGKISRFANFGVFVELAEELEGLCHISELSDERIEKPEKVFEIGQEMEFKILRIEPDAQKIGLSARAVGKEDEPVIDTKSYSMEAKSGMASLGELANLRNMFGGGSSPAAAEPKVAEPVPAETNTAEINAAEPAVAESSEAEPVAETNAGESNVAESTADEAGNEAANDTGSEVQSEAGNEVVVNDADSEARNETASEGVSDAGNEVENETPNAATSGGEQ
ncbi:MAG TPA: 30S ribosomal protein S1 [Pyrinomonadaceae bacterium]|jgi:small subunit ribosomal protein S1